MLKIENLHASVAGKEILKGLSLDVKPGQVVKTGQHIAYSGNTGNSSGPHLHFEIRKTANYGSAVDPVSFLRAKGIKL